MPEQAPLTESDGDLCICGYLREDHGINAAACGNFRLGTVARMVQAAFGPRLPPKPARHGRLASLRATYRQSLTAFVDEGEWQEVIRCAANILALDTELRVLKETDDG